MARHIVAILALFLAVPALRADEAVYERKQDVIYGRKYGMALTMDVFTPKVKPNGAAIVVIMSGYWRSDHRMLDSDALELGMEFIRRGYTCFAVVHSSGPMFNIEDAIDDINRAVRFIRYNAKSYAIDPDRIGITGASSGCHLALMVGMAGREGRSGARDPVDRVPSKVEAVAGFFPPTDFCNYGKDGSSCDPVVKLLGAPFDFRVLKFNCFEPVSEDKCKKILHDISPIYFVAPNSPPTLLIHGDRDPIVPLQQSLIMMTKLKECKVPCDLIVHKGGAHGWDGIEKDLVPVCDWFDKYLLKK
ncbi:MAG TPA: alpha/beta hydrolase [Gemmataceae bacterium]|nr:alpha/beta hydrolase [Gemmataceae bacterium]